MKIECQGKSDDVALSLLNVSAMSNGKINDTTPMSLHQRDQIPKYLQERSKHTQRHGLGNDEKEVSAMVWSGLSWILNIPLDDRASACFGMLAS